MPVGDFIEFLGTRGVCIFDINSAEEFDLDVENTMKTAGMVHRE